MKCITGKNSASTIKEIRTTKVSTETDGMIFIYVEEEIAVQTSTKIIQVRTYAVN